MSDQPPTTATGEPQRHTAGLVIIGNEVLSAKVTDANTPVLVERLSAHGVVVSEVAMLLDELERIADVVRDFARRFDIVITTGGVGPTHDDCTWKAVSRALDRPIIEHDEVVAYLEARSGAPISEAQRRMARLPEGTVFHRDGRGFVLQCDNVYVLPGIPAMVAQKVELIGRRWGAARPWLASAYFTSDEWSQVAAIDRLVAAFPGVEVGSYPIVHADDHRLKLTLEADAEQTVRAALHAVIEDIGRDRLVRVVWRDPSGVERAGVD